MTSNDALTRTRTETSAAAEKVRLLLADDNPAVLHQLCTMLKDQFEIVAAVPSGEAVLSQFARITPDVIILDISMGHLSGLDVARALREKGCRLPIVFLTVHTGADSVSAALSSGGSGYVVKSHMRSDLIPAIQAAMSGELFVSLSAV